MVYRTIKLNADSKGNSRMVFREVLFEEFRETVIKIDKTFFDSIFSDVVERLNMHINLLVD